MTFSRAFAVLAALSALSQLPAAVITSGTVTLDDTDLTQVGRLFRNAVPSVWGTAKAFPGITSAASTFNYELVPFNTSGFNQIQITYGFNSGAAANIFGVAYNGSFTASNLALNYLGDGGSSVTLGQPGPIIFQLDTGTNQNIVLAFSTTAATSYGTVNYTVEGFNGGVPEPATLGSVGAALALLAFLRRRRN